jgi:high-affinity iron transporter
VLGPLVITLREGLEAALVVGILLACLTRIGEGRRRSAVWLGVGLAVLASLLAGGAIFLTVGELQESAAQLFEGVTLIVAVGILSYMVLWMHRQAGDLRGNLQRQIAGASASRSNLPLALLAFVVVVREGLETGLFLFGSTRESQPIPALVGGLLGLAVAAGIGYGIYRGGLRLNLGAFFRVTGVLLVFFAAGMLAYGLHELVEASVFPAIVDPVYDLNAVLPDASPLGGFLKALLGYNGEPALSESVLYVVYLAGMLRFSLSRSERRVVGPQDKTAPAA